MNYPMSGAQWEYACRAGTTSALYTGKELGVLDGEDPNLGEIARYYYNQTHRGNSWNVSGNIAQDKGTATVGSYLPNAWGFYDMLGNVWEFTRDAYVANLAESYGNTIPTDPHPVTSKGQFVLKGGCWFDGTGKNDFSTTQADCRAAARRSQAGGSSYAGIIGFRV